MTTIIYSELRGEFITLESGYKELWIYDWESSRKIPVLIIPNKYALQCFSDFITKKLEELEE